MIIDPGEHSDDFMRPSGLVFSLVNLLLKFHSYTRADHDA